MIQYEWDNVPVSEYNRLRKLVGWEVIQEEQAEPGLKNSTVIAAVFEQKIVGMARLISDGGMMSFIVDVMVDPAYQDKGVGTLLMKKLLLREKEMLQKSEIKYISVLATVKNEKFYTKLGFMERPNLLMGAGMTIKLAEGKRYKFEKE